MQVGTLRNSEQQGLFQKDCYRIGSWHKVKSSCYCQQGTFAKDWKCE
jgi:hypothetical protein